MTNIPGGRIGNRRNVGGTTNVNATNETSNTGNATNVVDSGSTIAGGLAATASSYKPGEAIAKLAKKDTSHKTVELLSKPAKVTSVGVTYKMGSYEGRKLAPGEQMLLEVPPQFHGRPIRFAILKHRQDSGETSGTEGGDKWDQKPGSTALNVHTPEGEWRYWNAPWGSSGEDGGKFAEVRSAGDPESENMFDWMSHGHVAVDGHGVSYEPVSATAMRVRSVGEDPVRVHEVALQFLPDKPDVLDEAIFSKGTVFGDAWTGQGRKYGGGPSHGGKYPGAVQLGGYGGAGGVKLPEGWKLNGGALEVPLKPGLRFTGIEIAIGDTHPDNQPNKDGTTGTLGWSRLNMGAQRPGSSKIDWFTEEQGVPPEGVLFGGPNQSDFVAKSGDKLVIRSSSDTAYVMGVRVWYDK